MATRRIRRASLRGWWKGALLVLPPFAMLFSFAWFETQRLDNEFLASELATEVRTVNERIEGLKREVHQLRNVDRLANKASSFALHEPQPGQRVIIRPSEQTIARLHAPASVVRPEETPPTRIVIVRLEPDTVPSGGASIDGADRLAHGRRQP